MNNDPSTPTTNDTPSHNVPTETVDTARRSYERCCEYDDFFSCFYRNFFRNCPGVEPMFAHTDFMRQNRLLRHAIGLLLNFPNQENGEPTILSRVAERHGPAGLNVPSDMYPGFVESLIQTVAEHDPEFDGAIERAWRETIAPGIAYMADWK